MTAYTSNMPNTCLSRFLDATADWLHALAINIKERSAIKDVYNQLDALSDRELEDIGLGRGDIRDVARKSVLPRH